MKTLWIVHRREEERRWLAAQLPRNVRSFFGGPRIASFAEAPEPDLILLAVSEDYELELSFAREVSASLPRVSWLLAAGRFARHEVERLFDALPFRFLDLSDPVREIRAAIDAYLEQRSAEPLGMRREREAVAQRFRMQFADLREELLLPLLDPNRVDHPVWIEGEAGVGKRLLARYIHLYGHPEAGPMVWIGSETNSVEALWRAVAEAPTSPAGPFVTLVLDAADALAPEVQRALAAQLELGVLPVRASGFRVIALTSEGGRGLDESLERRLSLLRVRIPPLRERPGAAATFAEALLGPGSLSEDAATWLEAQHLRGNFPELEERLERARREAGGAPVTEALLRGGEGSADVLEAPLSPAPPGVASEPPASPDLTSVPLAEEPEVLAFEPEEVLAEAEDGEVRALSGALAHELRNPLSSIRTLAALLPEQHDDPDYRRQFENLVSRDVARMERALGTLGRFAELPAAERERCALGSLVEELLEERRAFIGERKLVVLKELELPGPVVTADAARLRFALGCLLDTALEWTEMRGDLYISVRAIPERLTRLEADAVQGIRLALRFQGGGALTRGGALAPAESSLALTLAEVLFRDAGGSVAFDAAESEGILTVDLPTAPA